MATITLYGDSSSLPFGFRFLFLTLKPIVSNIFLIATCCVDLFVVDVKYFHQWTCLFVCLFGKVPEFCDYREY